ncbi:MAG: 50S ribosomal protein L17 [Candidatus Colwellbacteria bacterium CG10_big_fil_rev_8_21_14_0_10_42_22]|uniref:50S ribosomal protein L17 n=1 Tax=Candidatus Colwellbacteria bacterium CG10_big_fil_rev_8_21_14_0_10_42_22 TaxID=1974540 RepID=A0A2H0VHS6_9BACT|nr:MAG: 50S ribosomal protein L17 [Candidatus Colwellbacteria bacterium CG10_big_fil_rev_8_21_14_0_10_42_22]
MRHLKKGRKFGLMMGKRRAFLRILVHNLIMEEKIETTEARAKEIRPRVEKLVTIAKKNNLMALRLLMRRLPKTSAYKLYHELAPKYKDRNGGYLRIRKSAEVRQRDGSRRAIIEFV